VTARRLAFFSDTIAHAALTGVALGFWAGLAQPTLAMVAFSLLIAGLMTWLKEKTQIWTDTIMALLLSGSVAAGIIILSLSRRNYQGDLHKYLFGDIVAVSGLEVWLSAALFLVITVVVFGRLSAWTLLTAHEEIAQVCGISVRALNYAFVLGLTLTLAVTIRLLGIILVTSLIVIPSATARNLSRNLRQQICISALVGLISGLGGTVLSYHLDLPCGPAIVLFGIVLFALSLAGSFAFRRTPALPARS
jgi:ABC-type Mn2+/Zn2+ transport system permease subunit